MKAKILGLLAVVLLAGPLTANAVVVTVKGSSWDIGTCSDTWLKCDTDHSLTLSPWYTSGVSEGPAITFAAAVGQIGLLFAYGYTAPKVFTIQTPAASYCGGPPQCPYSADPSYVGQYATYRAIAVPEPGTLVLLGLGLAGLGLRRRKAA